MTHTPALLVTIAVLTGTISLPAMASDAYGTPFFGEGFVKQDWQLVCDNTLTCRAAGYAPQSNYDFPASILLEVEPGKPVSNAKLNFYVNDVNNQPQGKTTLWLNGRSYGEIEQGLQLTAKQTEQIIKRARNHTKIELKSDDVTWTISDQGMTAVLLKLDAVQGRSGTPLALVSKNKGNGQTVKKLKPKPIIKKGFSYSEEDESKLNSSKLKYFESNMANWVKSTANGDDASECSILSGSQPQFEDPSYHKWSFSAIDDQHTLASHLCWRAAYNEGYGFWLIDNTNPSKPQLITNSGTDYTEGSIIAAHKGRGLGDCWRVTNWVWDGRNFVQSTESTSGLCRGFAGGAWQLPTYVSEVVAYEKAKN